jgi:DNA-binding CsgD family transcriptional regulator
MSSKALILLTAACLIGLAAAMTSLDAVVDASGDLLSDRAVDFLDRLLTIGTIFASIFVFTRLKDLKSRALDMNGAIQRAADEGRIWRKQSRRFLDGLSRSIDTQFDAWHLTSAEADVAGLLLKGASLREIAVLRRTSEATIRQQAQNVYRKSGLASRAELSAFFLEDLFTFSEATLSAEPAPDDRYNA